MFIELIDQLRCLEWHDETWLVATLHRQHERFVRTGILGCPICFREYAIAHGVAYFGVTPPEERPRPVTTDDPNMAIRAAAWLNASERSTHVLAGRWAPHAHAVTAMLPLRIFAVNPSVPMDDSEMVGVIETSDRIPLGMMSVNGVALDEATATPSVMASAVRILAQNGRLVAPVSVPVPADVQEIARDDVYWVGQVTHVAASGLVPLQRK